MGRNEGKTLGGAGLRALISLHLVRTLEERVMISQSTGLWLTTFKFEYFEVLQSMLVMSLNKFLGFVWAIYNPISLGEKKRGQDKHGDHDIQVQVQARLAKHSESWKG